ncbi:MAG: hypothetical protein JJ895_00190 [Balneolaceae bacterium]|nr:hypothetical protein [Balneolaceae bacterium]
MKATVSFLAIILFSVSALAQRTLIVDNTGSAPNGDHVYSDLQEAIDAAEEGDIIHVMPSSISYGDLNIDGLKNLSFVGIGMHPYLNNNLETNVSELGDLIILDGENLFFSGLKISSVFVGSNSNDSKIPTNILFNQTNLGQASIVDASTLSINNSFSGQLAITGQVEQIYVNNSIIKGRQGDINNTNFTNNILTNTEDFWSNTQVIRNCVFENNIFWHITALFNFGRSNSSNSIYRNNYSLFDLPNYGTNISENNITSVDGEIFVDIRIDEDFFGGWQSYWNTEIQAEELKNAGTDGTDIGPSGGNEPYRTEDSPLPIIKDLLSPLKIKSGHSFEVTIKAKGN